MAAAIKLIVGLGNPGPEHWLTRHNAGFWFADALAGKYALQFRRAAKFHAEVCRLAISTWDCYLCKPESFMNESGRAVQAIASFYKITPEEILVVHDEIDLPPGVVRLKQGGGHGGHNGLRDIIEVLGDSNFNRLRIGVGHPGSSEQVVGHVLNRAPSTEEDLIMQGIAAVLEYVPQILAGELQLVMNKLHRSEKLEVESERVKKESEKRQEGE
ncbi:MAG: aminoacyl-tRNA hydrolase [Candidatus Binatia bacterium]